MDQLPRLGKRELICLLLFTCNYVVSVWRGFLFLWMLGMGYVILLWPTNYSVSTKSMDISRPIESLKTSHNYFGSILTAQSQFITLLPSLIARRWSGCQTQ